MEKRTFTVYARFEPDGALYNMGIRQAKTACEAIRIVSLELDEAEDDAVEIRAIEEV